MNVEDLQPPEGVEDEVAALIRTLHESERRLEELTGGEVDTVSMGSGRPFLLRRAQEERRQSEAARQTAILDALPAHIALIDAQGVILSVNEPWRQFAAANGLRWPECAAGTSYLETCERARDGDAVEAQQAAEGIRSVLAGAANFSLEYPCHSPSEQRWYQMTVTPLAADDRRGAVVMHMDVTARRLAAAAFQELSRTTERRERMLTTTLSSLNDFAYIYDRAGRFLFANAPLLKLWGRTLDEVVGKDFFDLGYPPELARRLQRQIQDVIETRQSVKGETIYTSPSGAEGFFEYIFSPAFGADGAVEFVVGSTRDISERRQTEMALRESNLKFEQLADNLTDVFWIRSPDFSDLHYISPAFERIWGRSVASLRADPKQWTEFVLPEDRDRVSAAFAALTDSAPSLEVEYRITRPDGEVRWVRVRGSQVRNAEDQLVRQIGIVTDITAQVQAAVELRTSLAEFRQLAESMPQIVWITTAEGQNTYFSQQWMDYTGLTLEESLGDGWNTPFHPDDQQPAQEAWQRATTTAGIYEIESRLRRADGVYRWWLVRGVPHLDESGRIVKWFGTCTDIHDLKVAQLEIARVNRALKMLSGTNDALFREPDETALLNAVCRIAVEDGGYRMAWIGYAPDDEGRSVIPAAHAGAEDGYFSDIEASHGSLLEDAPAGQVLRTGKAVICDDLSHHTEFSPWLSLALARGYRGGICLPLGDGSRTFGVLGLFSFDTLETSAQELVLLQELADDLAFGIRAKRAEAERTRLDNQVREQAALLAVAEERTRFALRSAGLGIWEMDYATGVFRASEIMEGQLGLMPGTFGGTQDSLVQCVHPLDRAAMLATISDATRSGEEFTSEYRFQRPDGTIAWLNCKGRVQRDAQGQPVRGVGVSIDVTDHHRLEEQFHQAQKMEAVGRLAGGVAHDFNNLLTAILGYCELLQEGVVAGDPRADDIMEIHKAGTRAAGLTRQLLAFSRKQIIEPTLLDLNAIVADIWGMLGRLIGEDVKVALALSFDSTQIRADRGQVEQVVMNLAVNARDAMPNGGTLTIETTTVELDEHYAGTHLDVKPGQYVALTVSDTGTGMTADVQARLFEPFFTTKEVGKGTGLGLATVYGIVTRCGGSIGVYSELGKGTAFKVYFPRAAAAPLVAEAAAPIVRRTPGSQTVLVVEDEEGLRALTRRLLQRLGYTVLVAAHAAEARRLFDQHPNIHLLLTDVVMPGASGPELTNELREQRPTLKVIYMSGYTEDAIVHRGVLEPGIAFLHKPFTMRSLGEKIRDVLDD